MKDPIRIGVVGAGGIVTLAHLPAIASLPEAAIAWISDKSVDRARLIGRAYNVPGYGEDILDRAPDCDVILLAVPYGVREPYYARFGANGLGWYVEKPFAKTEAEHRDRCAALGSRRVACGFQRRVCGMVRVAREAVQDELFGRLRKVEMGFGQRGRILGGGTYVTDPTQAGGGILAEMGIHNVDAILYVTDATDVEIIEARTEVDHGMDIHTQASLKVTPRAGDPFECNFTVSNLVDTSEKIVLHFEHARLAFSIYGKPEIKVESIRGKADFVLSDWRELCPGSNDQIFHAYWQAFLRGLRDDKPSLALAEDSALATRVVERIYAMANHKAGGNS